MVKAAYSAYRERSIGLGAMGFHAYLQRKGIPFEGIFATGFNHKAFTFIKARATQATKELAQDRGEAPDVHGTGKRNTNLLAIAPNASSGIICSGTSPSIEPFRANCYTHKTLSGSYQVKNKYLEKVLKSKGLKGKELDAVWKDISGNDGSVQHLDILTDDEKEIFDLNTQDDVVNNLKQLGVKFGALKRGSKGPYSLTDNSNSFKYTIVTNTKDTTAAGDSFNGAYLASLINGSSQDISLIKGHKLASRVIQNFGAIIWILWNF